MGASLPLIKEPIEVKTEKVNHPKHYNTGKYEVIDVIEDWKLDFPCGNAVKYIARAGKKPESPEIEDLQKAVFYLQWKINKLKNGTL